MKSLITCGNSELYYSMRNEYRSFLVIFLAMSGLFCALQYKLADQTLDLSATELAGPDAYMWVNRVIDLRENGNWRDHNYPRIYPPAGHEQHWTRPFDMLLYAVPALGGSLSEYGIGRQNFESALQLWSMLISPLLGVIALFGMLCLSNRLELGDKKTALGFTGFLFIVQLGVFNAFAANRPDHQSILLCLFAWLLLIQARCQLAPTEAQGRWSITMGVVAAISMWISMEAILIVLIVQISFGLNWLRTHREQARQAWLMSITLAICSGIAIYIEFGATRFYDPVYDRLSIVHVVLFLLISLYWYCVAHPPVATRLSTVAVKLCSTAAASVLILGLMAVSYPDFFLGPLASVDEFYRVHRLQAIIEIQPLVRFADLTGDQGMSAVARLFGYLGVAIIVVPFGFYQFLNGDSRHTGIWLFQLVGIFVFVPLTLLQARWSGYAAVIMLPLYVRFCMLVRNHFKGDGRASDVLRASTTMGLIFWSLVPLVSMSMGTGKERDVAFSRACRVQDLLPSLESLPQEFDRTSSIIAHSDFGPELLFRTGFNVLSIPNHRYQPGFKATFDFMRAADADVARQLAAKHGIDLVMLCATDAERKVFAIPERGASFYDQMRDGSVPDWLQPIKVADNASESLRLYRVVRE